ncbi:hypothetical protein ANME2D_02310 [Candidatus Methanoperedens nitroreducens]|uniref:Uncharacterized protein n=1 Tax=Candidatus Methanoperedens nitratireducens TaxID=1392998 RepID=A0A062V862_9EURY|nr:DUF5803 family protein [Candidatus Methanoperedens nitroreducens]KCZ71575.1 hypothetical protein ANME2D_02310 [Candidatus Methanoperedens nitroreducens]MDJ1421203.1 DUF5803 family protein [Candidatus Methanoperedens sp.]
MRSGRILILVILLSVLAAGCVSSEIKTGSPEEYELPGLDNTTIFYLNRSVIQVVDSVTNATEVKIPVEDSGEMNFRSPVVVDSSGNDVIFNVSKETSFGRTYARFDFDVPFSGFIAFTQSDGQGFSRPLTKNGSVRIVLPVDYTTGTRLLGITSPEPDSIITDDWGREVLIWENPYPEHKEIKVNYYHKGAPAALLYFLVFLLIAALIIYSYYKFSMTALRKKREMMEKGVKE